MALYFVSIWQCSGRSYPKPYIKDNGRGIKPEDQDKMFGLFSTLSVTDRNNTLGSGIGLSTVKRLVEKLDGNIIVESLPGKGSTFIVTICR